MAAPLTDPALSTSGKPKGAQRRRRLPVWKKGLFAVIVTLAFFGAVELLLAAFGVKPMTYNEDPFVGFTSRSPLFENVQLPDGHAVYRTVPTKLQWFNSQEFAANKGKNDYRIFCMGGSTTYGHPYDDTPSFCGWLREYLAAADTSHHWDVINAGGISYASYRVASLMEELIQYEPDLFIIYCGQNEFLERRTYSRMIATPRAVRETAAILGRSRVYSTVNALLGNSRNAGSQLSSEVDKLPSEVNAILDGAVGPDDYRRDDEQRNQIVAHYRFNLVRMIEIARSVGAKIVFVNPAVNERSMSPFKSEHSATLKPDDIARWDQLIAQATSHQSSGELAQALNSLDQAIEIDPLYADTHFQRGEILVELDRDPEAKQAFQRAIDEDVCPLRMLSEMHPVIFEVAAQNDVPVVDFQKLLEQKTESGITDEEWFLDHVHTTVDGYRELALSLLDELQSEGIVRPESQWNEETRRQVDATVKSRIDARAEGIALRTLGKTLSWARKYEEAGRLAQLATTKLSDDAEVHCMAAYDFERNGQLEQAKKSYQIAVELRPQYTHALYNLGHVHRQLEEWELAAQSFQRAIDSDPNYPGAYYNLGLLYKRSNQLDRAAECFESSISVNDKHPGSREELGTVRLNQGRIDEAISHLELATKLEPNLASAHNSLGVAFAQHGELKKAVASFERALKIAPQFEAAEQNLERARKLVK
jgi:tetratricopeptide (TPR) repeat protein